MSTVYRHNQSEVRDILKGHHGLNKIYFNIILNFKCVVSIDTLARIALAKLCWDLNVELCCSGNNFFSVGLLAIHKRFHHKGLLL